MRNTIARRDPYKGAAQARRLLAVSQGPAHFALKSSIVIPDADAPILCRRASEATIVAGFAIQAGECYWLAESINARFAKRFYVVLCRNGVWVCSSREERPAALYIARVQALVASEEEVA